MRAWVRARPNRPAPRRGDRFLGEAPRHPEQLGGGDHPHRSPEPAAPQGGRRPLRTGGIAVPRRPWAVPPAPSPAVTQPSPAAVPSADLLHAGHERPRRPSSRSLPPAPLPAPGTPGSTCSVGPPGPLLGPHAQARGVHRSGSTPTRGAPIEAGLVAATSGPDQSVVSVGRIGQVPTSRLARHPLRRPPLQPHTPGFP